MLAALIAIAELTATDQSFSELIANCARYPQSGEINSEVPDAAAAIERMLHKFGDGHEIDRLDGITITAPSWWLNVRASNTEPLVRLNVEADTQALLQEVTQAALGVIRDF